MKIISLLLWHACISFFLEEPVKALPYDYSATTECLEEAWKVQYNGGIIQNPEFNYGTEGWKVHGQGKIEERITKDNNKFVVAHNRIQPSHGLAQRVDIVNSMLYAFSAWIQISKGSEVVAVVFRSPSGQKIHGGTVKAEQGCWSMLKGGIVANFSGPVDISFETSNTEVEVWVDNVSLQPFTEKQWRAHQDKSISKVRKNKVKFHVTNTNKSTVTGAKLTLTQTKPSFPIGVEINQHILNTTAYKKWFTSRFTATTFGNEMKWYSTEKIQGQENYTVADAMLQFCEQNNIAVRGHNIFWDDPQYQPPWENNLTTQELQAAIEKRMESVVLRYKGRLIAWDVMNENLHFHFYEDKLGQNASAEIYARSYELDQKPILFMNEYNTIESSNDLLPIPAKYASKMQNIVSYYRQRNGNKTLPMGIGLESRFAPGQPNFAYMRAGLDYLASMGFPIWLTEVFVDKGDNQEKYLDGVLREGYSHPAVKGMVIWPTSPFDNQCKMCLTDKDFVKNTPTGDVVDNFIAGLRSSKPLELSANMRGYSEAVLPHGDYEVTVRDPNTNYSNKLMLKVTEDFANFVQTQLDESAPYVYVIM